MGVVGWIECAADGGAVEVTPCGIVVGRIEECAVVLDDSTVTRRHARVRQVGDADVIEDLDSDNGTYVNGDRIECATVLRPGDEIQCGMMILRYSNRDPRS